MAVFAVILTIIPTIVFLRPNESASKPAFSEKEKIAFFYLFTVDDKRKSVMSLVDLLAELPTRKSRLVCKDLFHAQCLLHALDILEGLVTAVKGEHYRIMSCFLLWHTLV